MRNESGIHPSGHRILVLPDPVENQTDWGFQTATDRQQEREEMAQVDGILVAVGPEAWEDQKARWAHVGERVMFAKYCGTVRTGKDVKRYRVMNDLDVVAVIEDTVK